MRSNAIVTGTALLAGLGLAVTSAQVQPVPGPGTGVVTVMGEVSVANRPTVEAAQQGDWRVSIANTAPVSVANTPTVALAIPVTVKTGARYEIVWPTGEREEIVAAGAGTMGWVRTERGGVARARWVNLAAARSVAEVP